uniref:Uncharacterized protein n=1 Tax=viral metagenome TaxID=1070528 RepID=A0A6C0J9B6_9ZZZZ
MRSLSFFFFMLGIIFITIGYMNNKLEEKHSAPKIEYRFVPRTIYDDQIESIDVNNTYSDMFSDIDPILV